MKFSLRLTGNSYFCHFLEGLVGPSAWQTSPFFILLWLFWNYIQLRNKYCVYHKLSKTIIPPRIMFRSSFKDDNYFPIAITINLIIGNFGFVIWELKIKSALLFNMRVQLISNIKWEYKRFFFKNNINEFLFFTVFSFF